MPNNVRTQIDAVWIDGYTPPASDWEDLERKIFGSWNGVRGGAYCAPAGASGSAYTIAGSGLQVTGSTRLTYGGSILGSANVFKVRDATWPELVTGHAGRTRSIVQPIHGYMSERPYLWSQNHIYGGVGSVALACRRTYGRVIETPELYVSLRVVDGSTLTKVTVHFRVAQRRVYAPIAMPKFRVLRVSASGDSVPLKLTADGLGFDAPALVTTPEAWYLEGAAQTFEYVCDQHNVIDVSQYHYVVQIIEEKGLDGIGDAFDGIRLVERKEDVEQVVPSTTVLDGLATTTEGRTLSVADKRVLVADPDTVLATGLTDNNSAKNGVWLTNATAWTRATDLDEQDDFSPNWIVSVTYGRINASAVWQCQHPTSASRVTLGAVASASNTQPRLVPAEPKGNIYHSLVPTFEVSDLRFQ